MIYSFSVQFFMFISFCFRVKVVRVQQNCSFVFCFLRTLQRMGELFCVISRVLQMIFCCFCKFRFTVQFLEKIKIFCEKGRICLLINFFRFLCFEDSFFQRDLGVYCRCFGGIRYGKNLKDLKSIVCIILYKLYIIFKRECKVFKIIVEFKVNFFQYIFF